MEEIKASGNVPDTVFHVVPSDLFESFVGTDGDYDCRNRLEWGKGSGFIHTTSDIRTLKERILGNFTGYDAKIDFFLLKIDTSKVLSEFTYAIQNSIKYFHVWGPLPKGSFDVSIIKRTRDGGFVI